MSKKENLNQKIKSYSALAGATLAGVAANGQTAYTDVDPDVVLDEVGEYFDLDINNDGIIDFKLEYSDKVLYSSSYGGITYGAGVVGPIIQGFGKYNRVQGKRWTKGMYLADVKDDSALVYGKFKGGGNTSLFRGVYSKRINGEPIEEYSDTYGAFDSVINKYIGLSFRIGENSYPAWVRVDVIPTNEDDTEFELRIKDFAYRKNPGAPIPAGIGENIPLLPPPTNVVAMDTTNFFTSQDINVKFDSSASESNVDQYGIMILKSEDADGITIDDLINSEGGEPVEVPPSGLSRYSVTLPPGQLDIDGDPVITGRAYKILVYALEEDGFYDPSWSISNEITLSSSNAVATNVVASDIADNGNASDMQISFTKAVDEASVNEYRIAILRENQLDNFDSTAAVNLIAARYTAVAKDGSDKEIVLDPSALNNEGGNIQQGTDYYAIIITDLGDGNVLLSPPSNKIRLGVPAPKITAVSAYDINDNGDARDIEIHYMSPVSDTAFNDVRAIILPKFQMDELSEEDILDLNSAYSKRYNNFDTLGVMDTINLNPFTQDAYGKFIEEGVEYTIYMSTTPRGKSTSSTLGESATITLTSPIKPITDVVVASIGSNFNPSDWRVISNLPENAKKVTEYRIMAVPSAEAGSFDLTIANAVTSDNYVVAQASENGISQVMPADLKDVNGDAIVSTTDYNFFVLAIGDKTTKENVLSDASNKVALEKVNSIDNAAIAGSSKIYFNQRGINFYIPAMTESAKVSVISINGSVIFNGRLDVGQEVINPGSIETGVYIVNVYNNEFSISKKLLVK